MSTTSDFNQIFSHQFGILVLELQLSVLGYISQDDANLLTSSLSKLKTNVTDGNPVCEQ